MGLGIVPVKILSSSGAESHWNGISVTAEEVITTRLTERFLFAASRTESVTSSAGCTMSFS